MTGPAPPPPSTIHLDPASAAARKLAEWRAGLAVQRARAVSWQETLENLIDIVEATGR